MFIDHYLYIYILRYFDIYSIWCLFDLADRISRISMTKACVISLDVKLRIIFIYTVHHIHDF